MALVNLALRRYKALSRKKAVLASGLEHNEMKDIAKFVKQLNQDKFIQNKLMRVSKKANHDKYF